MDKNAMQEITTKWEDDGVVTEKNPNGLSSLDILMEWYRIDNNYRRYFIGFKDINEARVEPKTRIAREISQYFMDKYGVKRSADEIMRKSFALKMKYLNSLRMMSKLEKRNVVDQDSLSKIRERLKSLFPQFEEFHNWSTLRIESDGSDTTMFEDYMGTSASAYTTPSKFEGYLQDFRESSNDGVNYINALTEDQVEYPYSLDYADSVASRASSVTQASVEIKSQAMSNSEDSDTSAKHTMNTSNTATAAAAVDAKVIPKKDKKYKNKAKKRALEKDASEHRIRIDMKLLDHKVQMEQAKLRLEEVTLAQRMRIESEKWEFERKLRILEARKRTATISEEEFIRETKALY